jgi:hypothetical protein
MLLQLVELAVVVTDTTMVEQLVELPEVLTLVAVVEAVETLAHHLITEVLQVDQVLSY